MNQNMIPDGKDKPKFVSLMTSFLAKDTILNDMNYLHSLVISKSRMSYF